jgi:hypothetical protein
VIALVRAPLFAANRRVKETTDVYTLPPPRELVVLSLGYRSALADLLWAHVLVSQGLHTEQRRRFDDLTQLLDAVNELEPTYRDPYLFAESLITFQTKETPVEDVRKARAILERGVANRPLDGELWLALGEFVGFVAPGTYLTDPAEQAAWRVDGATFLARAAELSGDNAFIAWQAIGGAGLLGRAGERDAQIRFLYRTLVVTDDVELQDKIKAQLARLLREQHDQQRDDRGQRVNEAIKALHLRDLPQLAGSKGRTEYMLLGPPRDPAFCAGDAHERDLACAPSWRAWEERSEELRAAAPRAEDTP